METDDAVAAKPTTEIDVPEQIGDDLFNELYSEPATKAAVDEKGEVESDEEETVDADDLDEESEDHTPQSGPSTQEMVAQTVRATLEGLQSAKPGEKPRSAVDILMEKNPDMKREDVQWMVDQVTTVTGGELSQIKNALAYLNNRVNEQTSESIRSGYDKHLDGLLDKAKVESKVERRAIKALVTQEGMAQYRDKFDLQAATRVFRQINSERVESAHATQKQYKEKKAAKTKSTPPIQTSTSDQVGVEDIRKGLRNLDDKSFNLNGKNFRRLLKNLAEKGEQAALG